MCYAIGFGIGLGLGILAGYAASEWLSGLYSSGAEKPYRVPRNGVTTDSFIVVTDSSGTQYSWPASTQDGTYCP